MREISRAVLYQLVWGKPMTRLAQEFGLSGGGLAKVCDKFDVPRPPRGYWTQIAAGHKPRQTPLPEGENISIRIDTAENAKRRAKLSADAAGSDAVQREIETAPVMPGKHELATRVEKALEAARLAEDGRISVRRHTTPSITVSPDRAPSVVDFLSTLAHTIEARGINLVSGKNEGEPLRFQRGADIVHLTIEDEVEHYEVEPTPEQKRQPSWTWNNKRSRPCGRLSFRLTSPGGTQGRCKWTESASSTAMDLLPKVAARIECLFTSWEEERQRQAQWEAERAERARLDAEKQVQDRHRGRLREVSHKRRTSLFRAADWFRIHGDILALIQACEARWRTAGNLSPEQSEWLSWAGKVAEAINPLAAGYPDPAKDGPFEAESIPVGGPYPGSGEIPVPQSLREIEQLLKDWRPSGYGHHGW